MEDMGDPEPGFMWVEIDGKLWQREIVGSFQATSADPILLEPRCESNERFEYLLGSTIPVIVKG